MKKTIFLSFALLLITAQVSNAVERHVPSEYDTIQEAIDDCVDGDTVIVAPGTYTGDGNRDISLNKVITILSESGPDGCVIDCNGTEAEPHRAFYLMGNSRIIGFTIINGYADAGGAIYCEHNASPEIINCILTDNSAMRAGGAICCQDDSLVIINCTIKGNSVVGDNWQFGGGGIYAQMSTNINIINSRIIQNTANSGGGIYCWENSSLTVIDSAICNNIARGDDSRGGGIYFNGSSSYRGSKLIMTNCIINNNSVEGRWLSFGGGIYYGTNEHYPAAFTIINCTVNGNSAKIGQDRDNSYGGGIFCHQGSPIISECRISGNMATEGGGISCEQSSPIITGCIISGNSPLDRDRFGGGGIHCSGGSTTINNCTIVGNSFFGINCRDSKVTVTNSILCYNGNGRWDLDQIHYNPVAVTYSDVQTHEPSPWPGIGNINADPCFVESGYWDVNTVWIEGNYHLLPNSPCINAGGLTSYLLDNTDLDGNPRVIGSRIDMGAYEYEVMVSCFGVNHVKLETKAGKKGNKVELKGTFSPALPIDFAVDDVTYIIDDGQGNALVFLIPAGSFEPEGKPEKQKFKFDSPKHGQPDIKARFDFDKCKFELKAKRVQGTDEITSTTLTIELWAGANVVEEVVQVQVKPKHTEYKREPKLECCPKCKGIALLEVTSDQGVFVFEPEPGKEKLKRNTVVDDGVNGPVRIDTSCSKPLEVGDVFGPYTITDLIKIFDDWPDDENDE